MKVAVLALLGIAGVACLPAADSSDTDSSPDQVRQAVPPAARHVKSMHADFARPRPPPAGGRGWRGWR